MKRGSTPTSKRQRRTARGMLPVYRDVHPDRSPVECYDDEGNIAIRGDMPTSLVERLDRTARKHRVPFQAFLVATLTDQIEKLTWGRTDLES